MDYVTLGHSGLKVSRACLGTMNFSNAANQFGIATCDEDESRRIVDAFLDAGNNFIDTANIYNAGASEEIVGRAIKSRRDDVVLATKAGGPMGEGPNARGLSRVNLTRSLDDSLRRLGTDHIDLYQCHMWFGSTPIAETMATLNDFVRAGKVRYIGCSNFTAAQIVEAQWAAARDGGVGFTSLQPHYSLVAREIEAEVLPTAARHGLGTLIYSPLAGGILSGRYRRGTEPDPNGRIGALKNTDHPAARELVENTYTDRNLAIAEEVAAVAAELDTTSVAVALAWALRREHITSVIIGPRTFEQYQGNQEGFTLQLPDAAMARLDAISQPSNVPVNGAPFARSFDT